MSTWKSAIQRQVRRTKIFVRIGRKRRLWIIKIFALSALIRATILIIPFKRIKKHLGIHNEESTLEVEEEIYELASEIGWIIPRVCKKTPWESKCLVQAIIAQRLLKKEKIDSTLYLGVAKEESGELMAHAWLRCGTMIVTGGGPMPKYKAVAKFAMIHNKSDLPIYIGK